MNLSQQKNTQAIVFYNSYQKLDQAIFWIETLTLDQDILLDQGFDKTINREIKLDGALILID